MSKSVPTGNFIFSFLQKCHGHYFLTKNKKKDGEKTFFVAARLATILPVGQETYFFFWVALGVQRLWLGVLGAGIF